MGLDVCLYRYTGDRTYDEDNQELEEHSDALENFWHEIRIEVAGEPVKIMKETPFGVKETEKKLTSEQYKEIRRIERIRQSHYIEQNNLHLTLGDYGAEISEEQTEIDSEKYPDHMFKIGYMRSSYNSGGFNSVVKKIVGHDLYWLFGVEDVQEYVVRPDWKTALIRCDMLLDQLGMDQGYNIIRIPTDNILSPDFIRVGEPTDERNSLKKFMGIMEDDTINDEDGFIIDGFQMLPKGKCLLAVVNTQDGYGIVLKGEDGEPYVFHPKNKSVADTSLAVFQLKMYDRKKQQEENHAWDMSSFSCIDGWFFLNGIDVRGFQSSCDSFHGHCLDFVSYEPDGNQWYREATFVVKEMIEWILSKEDPSEYYFHWSG